MVPPQLREKEFSVQTLRNPGQRLGRAAEPGSQEAALPAGPSKSEVLSTVLGVAAGYVYLWHRLRALCGTASGLSVWEHALRGLTGWESVGLSALVPGRSPSNTIPSAVLGCSRPAPGRKVPERLIL